jgi:plastocyanin
VRRALLPAALLLAAAAPGAGASERVVDMPSKFFVPGNLTVLAGDTVTWTNSDGVDHDVASLTGAFDSGHITPGGRFSYTFPVSGHFAYRCTIHAFMAGAVDVYAFQLLGPSGPIAAGSPVTLRGLAPAGTPSVRIEARRPDLTWLAVASVVPGPDGAFKVRVTPAAPTTYRAVVAAGPSLPLPLRVGAALETKVKRVKGGGYAIRATAKPAQAGAPAALQLYSRERFRWRQVAHATVGRDSRVSFRVSPPGRYAARVVLLRGKGGYGASVGRTVHLGGRAKHRGRRPAPMPHEHHHMG